jgi:hypothetical protein
MLRSNRFIFLKLWIKNTTGERVTANRWTRGGVDLRIGLDDMERRKHLPYRKSNSDSSAVHPVASNNQYLVK